MDGGAEGGAAFEGEKSVGIDRPASTIALP
jgi:hypothetical protein